MINFIIENGFYIFLVMFIFSLIFMDRKIFIVITIIFGLIEIIYLMPEATRNKILKEAPTLKKEDLKGISLVQLTKLLDKIENDKVKKIERQILSER